MPGFTIKRDDQGRFSIRTWGCCGNIDRWQTEYERAFVDQTLRAGGRIESADEHTTIIIDRKGRRHAIPTASCQAAPIGAP